MSDATRHSIGRLTLGYPAVSYVIARHENDSSEVLCVLPASGEKTLPVFASREAARRFLRSGPLRFGLLGSGWRVRKSSGGELASLLFGPRTGVRRVVLDPSPEVLIGDYAATPTVDTANLVPWFLQ